MENQEFYKNTRMTMEVSIRLIALFLLIAWCLLILVPFIGPVIWGIIIAVSVAPLYNALNKRLGGKSKLSSFLLIGIFVVLIAVPGFIMVKALLANLKELGTHMNQGTLHIPPPNEKVASWPLIGDSLYEVWNSFSQNLTGTIKQYEHQLATLGKKVLSGITTLVVDMLLIIVSFIIAGILLATKGTRETMDRFVRKLAGRKGDEITTLAEATIRNVTRGILGVALIQGLVLGILFLLADVPYAGLWALICLMLAIIQLPATLVGLPVIIYIYSVNSPGIATVWAVLILAGSLMDNFLKPILLGRGAPVPMLVIFLGAIGGFILSGMMGLFTGAIVLSLGYKFFIAWLYEDQPSAVN